MMEMLIQELVELANDPRAWLAVAGLAAVSLHGLWIYLRCPLVHGELNITPEAAREAVHRARVHSTRFLVLMVLGICLALGGMAMIALGTRPPLALGLIAGGLFLIQTEPLRLSIRDRRLRVVAAEMEGPAARRGAKERLQAEYQKLLVTNVALTAGVAVYLLSL